ncbi:nicotinate-nucleotide--dimethylbenzimidazole phosphoribosyltransferase [Natronospira proteinivora]|uniref:Nicotinate-nucleotide--dimethylbenzimidazole phosphoribosyltransferase n=1 Tax=Natronospira proteinivora TaxID=1807133 RepID=A0ABT1G6B2_9GAMM|nr:nicotinate-nucleotide--dimethylbenzimidazole phosphoribosyltransferase [Natronospira proteinivora]MCP1726830.1 nicotinate-nucleotide--dimethylbenzimidazole phosphoribosyltransferase [Natronospira proteinivora]
MSTHRQSGGNVDETPIPGLATLPAISPAHAEAAATRWDSVAKPPGSLGQLEAVVNQLAAIQHQSSPRTESVSFYLFAADHGMVNDGVSAWPSMVTGAMLSTFALGRGAINRLCERNNVRLQVVDAGVAHRPAAFYYAHAPSKDSAVVCPILDLSQGRGTQSAVRDSAMSLETAHSALLAGYELIRQQALPTDMVGLGEMGIGNTASASLISHALSGHSLDACIGRGAGLDDEGLARKRDCLEQSIKRAPLPKAPMEILARFGGFEIAMMAGAALGAASDGRAVLVDGFIATAAVALACRMVPGLRDYCLFCHESTEPGHRLLLDELGARPLLDLSLALGEGSGAAMAVPLIQNAAACHAEMDTIESVLTRAETDPDTSQA